MSDLRKIYSLFVLLSFMVFLISGAVSFTRSSFDLGINRMESQIFDLQVKLKNLSTGNLLSALRGWDAERQQESVKKLVPPEASYVFGVDYLVSLLSSSSIQPSASGASPGSNFPEISLIGVSATKNAVSVTVGMEGGVQIWIFRKGSNGKWETKDAPPGFIVEDMEFTRDYISFVLSLPGGKKKYNFAISAVPEQYAAH
jgi:hypothetical protein